MFTIPEVVELAKKKTGADNATAKAIGAPRQTVGKWRKGENGPGRVYFRRLCELAEVNPADVLEEPTKRQATPAQQQQAQAAGGDCVYYVKRLIRGIRAAITAALQGFPQPAGAF